MKNTHRSTTDLLRLQQSQLTRNSSADGVFGYMRALAGSVNGKA